MFGVSEKSMNKGHNLLSCDEYNVKVFIMSICKGEQYNDSLSELTGSEVHSC